MNDESELLRAKSDAMLNTLFGWHQEATKEALRLTGELALARARIKELETPPAPSPVNHEIDAA